MINRYAFAGLCLAVCVIVYGHASDGAPGPQGESLASITSLSVVVEDISPEMRSLGLDPDVIRTDTEFRLRRSGIKVEAGPDRPWLCIMTQHVDRGRSFYYFTVRVFFYQLGTLLSNGKTMYVITWDRRAIGGGGGKMTTDTIRHIRKSISDMVDEFINDFLAANPK